MEGGVKNRNAPEYQDHNIGDKLKIFFRVL